MRRARYRLWRRALHRAWDTLDELSMAAGGSAASGKARALRAWAREALDTAQPSPFEGPTPPPPILHEAAITEVPHDEQTGSENWTMLLEGCRRDLWSLEESLASRTRRCDALAELIPGLAIVALPPVLLLLAFASYALAKHRGAEGVWVTYYQGLDFDRPLCRRTERVLFRTYDNAKPARGVPRDGFSARWEGRLLAPVEADYVFFSESDGGLRFYVDGDLLMDSWGVESWRGSARHGGKFLAAGSHALLIEFADREGFAGLRVKWAGGPVPANTVLAVPYLLKE